MGAERQLLFGGANSGSVFGHISRNLVRVKSEAEEEVKDAKEGGIQDYLQRRKGEE